MAYSKQTWIDDDESSPISAQRLQHLEDGVEAAHNVNSPRLAVATIATANKTAAANSHNPVDATSGNLTITLPTGQAAGTVIVIEKTDSSTNTVTCSGSIRGSASTLPLALARESIEFLADSAGSWWPIAGHKTLSSLDRRKIGGLVSVDAFGADPTGASFSDAAFASAKTAMGTNGQLLLGAGTYKFSGAIPTFGPGQGIRGPGSGATNLVPYGTGDFIRVYQSSFNSALRGGVFEGFTVDGTNAGTGSVGIHYGDMTSGRMRDINIKNFTTTGAIGMFFHNLVGWSERLNIDISVGNCTRNFVFDGSNDIASAASFMYGTFRLKAFINPDQEGFTLQNGASFIGATHEWTWNTTPGSSSHTGKVIHLGTTTEALASSFYRCSLNWVGESTGAGAFGHQTIVMEGTSSVAECFGIIKFHGATHATGVNNGNFWFGGTLYVDNAFGKSGTKTALMNSGGVVGKLGLVTAGNIFLDSGNVFKAQLASGANTLTFDSSAKVLYANGGMASVYEIFIQQPSSGGAGTVTWPTITWLSGTTPILSTTNNAVDAFSIITFDHQTMYGVALAPKSLAGGAVVALDAGGAVLKDATSAPATPSTGAAIYAISGVLKAKSSSGISYVLAPVTKINAQAGTTYTLAATDEGKTIDFTGTSAATLTVPTNTTVAFPIGTTIQVVQSGTGQVTIAGGGGVNLYVKSGYPPKTGGQYQVLYLTQRSADNWVVSGGTGGTDRQTITTSYSILTTDGTIFCNGSSVTATLPTASSALASVKIANIHASANATVASAGGTINGATTFTLEPGSSAIFESTGTNWVVF